MPITLNIFQEANLKLRMFEGEGIYEAYICLDSQDNEDPAWLSFDLAAQGYVWVPKDSELRKALNAKYQEWKVAHSLQETHPDF